MLSVLSIKLRGVGVERDQHDAILVPAGILEKAEMALRREDEIARPALEVVGCPTEVAIVSADTMRDLLTGAQELAHALWWSMMTNLAVLRARIVDHGRRDARERLAHLFCELLVRYRMVGLADGDAYPLPLTQEELADGTGLTSVHINRMMQSLRAEKLIEHRNRRLKVLDFTRLAHMARFDSSYLHIRRAGAAGRPELDRSRRCA